MKQNPSESNKRFPQNIQTTSFQLRQIQSQSVAGGDKDGGWWFCSELMEQNHHLRAHHESISAALHLSCTAQKNFCTGINVVNVQELKLRLE